MNRIDELQNEDDDNISETKRKTKDDKDKQLKIKNEETNDQTPDKKLDNSADSDEEDEDNILEKSGNILHAKIHGNAMKILNVPDTYQKDQKVKFCSDCYLPEETEGIVKKYNYCVDDKDLIRNGTGLYFFFFFHKILIFNLIGLFCIAGIPFLIYNKIYTDELNKYCSKFYIEDTDNGKNEITFPQTHDNLCQKFLTYTQNDILNKFSGESMYMYGEIMKKLLSQEYVDKIIINYQFIAFICLIVLFIANFFFVSLSQNILKELDYGNINVNDYTLLISDLNEDDYEKMTKKENDKPLDFIDDNLEISSTQINYTYKISEIYKLKQKIKELKAYQIKYKGQENYTTGPCYNSVTHLTKDIPNEIKEIKEKIKSLEETNKYTFSGVIFVTFKNINDLKKFKKNYPSTFIQKVLKSFKNCCLLRCCCCFLNDKDAKKLRSYLNLTVFKPPEPEDIIFSNLEFSFCYRFTKSVVNYLKVILLLGISFGSCLLFNYIQHKSEKNFESKTTLQYGISLCITVVTSLINFFIKSSFSDYTENEKMWSYTDKYLSLSIKISIFTFFNSGIVPLLTNYIEYGWESHENLVNNMFMIFLCGSLVAPLSSLTCYDLLLNKIMKWWKVTRKYKDEKKIIKEYTQDELNKIFELPTMGVSMQYSYLVQQFCMAFFSHLCFQLELFLLL